MVLDSLMKTRPSLCFILDGLLFLSRVMAVFFPFSEAGARNFITEREMRRVGQAVGKVDPGWGNVEGSARSSEETWSGANMERGNMTGGNMIGRRGAGNGSADRDIRTGTPSPSGGGVGGECMGTKEAKPNRLLV
jgi:hypothetical protein